MLTSPWGGESYWGRQAALRIAGDDRDLAAAEERGEVRSDGAGGVRRRPRRVGRVAREVRADHLRNGRVLERRERELTALLLRRAGRRVVGDLLAAEGVAAVVAREDLGLGGRGEAADRERLQVAVTAVGRQSLLVDRERLGREDGHLPREVERRALSRLERQEVSRRGGRVREEVADDRRLVIEPAQQRVEVGEERIEAVHHRPQLAHEPLERRKPR